VGGIEQVSGDDRRLFDALVGEVQSGGPTRQWGT